LFIIYDEAVIRDVCHDVRWSLIREKIVNMIRYADDEAVVAR